MNDVDIKKLNILKDIFGEYKREGREQFVFYCPECNHHKAKLSINLQKGAKCWICDLRSKDIFDLIKKYGTRDDIRRWRELTGATDFSELQYLFHIVNEIPKEKKEKLTLPEEFNTLVTKKLSVEGKMAKSYLFKRGITEKEILFYKMGYCLGGRLENRVVVPSFDDNGKLNYYIARSFDDNKRKYLYPQGIKHSDFIINELYVNFNEPIFLVEGIFDALKIGTQAIPILGSELSSESKLFQKIIKHNSKVVISLDPDAKKKEIFIAKKLLNYGIEVSTLQIPNNFKDIGEMTKEQFNEINNSSIFSLTNESLLRYNLEKV